MTNDRQRAGTFNRGLFRIGRETQSRVITNMQAMYSEQKHLTISTCRTAPPQTHTHQKKMGPAGLYSDLQPGRIGNLEGQSSGTWPRLHGLPTCPCGARDSCGRAWEDRTLQPPWWDSNPHGQPRTKCQGTKTKWQTPASTNTEDGQQTRRDDPDGSHRQIIQPLLQGGRDPS